MIFYKIYVILIVKKLNYYFFRRKELRCCEKTVEQMASVGRCFGVCFWQFHKFCYRQLCHGRATNGTVQRDQKHYRVDR